MRSFPRKWLVGLLGTTVLILSGSMLLMGSPIWKALLLPLIIITMAGVGLTIGAGLGVTRSRAFLAHGIDLALKADFTEARRWILAAVRIDRSLLKIQRMHRIYELVVAGDTSLQARVEIQKAKEEMSRWPKPESTAVLSDLFSRE